MNNNSKDIRNLLERFYSGETTEAEERELRELLEQTTVEEFETDRLILRGLEQSVKVPDDLEERLSSAIDDWDAAERVAERRRWLLRPVMWRRVAGIAASVALLVGLGVTVSHGTHVNQAEMADASGNHVEAYAATEKALTIFATALNKGIDGVEFAEQVSDKAMSTAMGI